MGTYVRLAVAGEMYAVPVRNVVEIADVGELTAVPGAPAEVLGLRNLRGVILPVIDLARLFGTSRDAPPGELLVAEASSTRAALAIDDVTDVGELPDPVEEAESDFLLGALLYRGDLIGVVDVPAIFSSLQGEVA
jgi:chemotaxis signal transduction protein